MIRNAHPLPILSPEPSGWVQQEIDAQTLIATREEALELIAVLMEHGIWFLVEPYPDDLWYLAVNDSADLPSDWKHAFLQADQEEAPAILGPRLVSFKPEARSEHKN